MKKFYSIILFLIMLLSCLYFVGCNSNTQEPFIDINEFKIEKINQVNKDVLFQFTYTQEMFDYEIKNKSWTSNQGDLLIRYRIKGSEELKMCGNINAMYGIKYDKGDYVFAHKPNEKVYFYIELEPGTYNLTFYLEYAANSPYILLRECSLSFSVL